MYPLSPLECKLLHPLAKPLTRAEEGRVGYDLHACIDAPLSLRFGEMPLRIPVGVAVSVPPGLAALILPLNSAAHHRGLVLGNTVGVLATCSEQQWQVSAWNRGPADEIHIRPGDAIAQVIFVPVLSPTFKIVETFSG